MKYLYILTSNDTDFLLEEALLSITSLRLQTPNAFVSLLTDTTTEANLKGKRNEIRNIIDELIVVEIDMRFDKKACSRWLKTSMRRHIKGDFIYIDSDTIITEDISSIADYDLDMGAVLDVHAYLNQQGINKHFRLFHGLPMKLDFASIFLGKEYFNGGVIFCRDSVASHDFFNEWHKLWCHYFENGVVTDQQSFNLTNYNFGNIIMELDGQWNCQITVQGAVRYLSKAKILHCFHNGKVKNIYLLSENRIFENIKETGFVTQELKNMLKDAKSLFLPDVQLQVMDKTVLEVNEETFEFHNSASYVVEKRLYRSKLWFIIESALEFMLKATGRNRNLK